MAAVSIGQVMVEDKVNGTKVYVRFGPQLLMDCACGVELWCDHRAVVMSRALDAAIVRQPLHNQTAASVKVPIFPTRNMYFAGYLRRVSESSTDMLSLTQADDFLGVITQGEGLGALRQIILARLEAITEVPGETLLCESAGHRYSAEKELQQKIEKRDMPWIMANDFSIWQTKYCMRCRRGEQEDFNEFVPEYAEGRPATPW